MNQSARTKLRPLMWRSGNLGSALIKKWRQRKLQGGHGTINWYIKPRSESSCLRISCESGQQWIMLLVRHQQYPNTVILIYMTWFGTIQGSIPTLMIKIGPWDDGWAFITGLEVIYVIGYYQNQPQWLQRQMYSILQDMICLMPRLQNRLKTSIQL